MHKQARTPPNPPSKPPPNPTSNSGRIYPLALVAIAACVSGRTDISVSHNTGECSPATAGTTRWNATLRLAEICDGDEWSLFDGSQPPATALLALTPAGQLAFAVNGHGNPAVSAWATVRIKNHGLTASAPLTFVLSNPHHFELDAGPCASLQLEPGVSCELRLRARASSSSVFEGFLVVAADNEPTLALTGVAVLDCPVGQPQAGGRVAACAEDGYYLIAAPGGCDGGVGEPDCSALLDRVRFQWGPSDTSVGTQDSLDGPGNTEAIVSLPSGVYPAATYCDDLVLDDYDDWYLPAVDELSAMLVATEALPGFRADEYYWSSSESIYIGLAAAALPVTGGSLHHNKGLELFVRCTRRDLATPPVLQDDCTVGGPGPGGIFAACGGAYDLVVSPAGCDGATAEPTCEGAEDVTRRIWAPVGYEAGSAARDALDGAQNSVNLQARADLAGFGSFPAVGYCMALVYRGYDDWYLPASGELELLTNLQRGGTDIGIGPSYWTSTEVRQDHALIAGLDVGSSIVRATMELQFVRCTRRQGVALPSVNSDPTGCEVGAQRQGGTYVNCGSSVNLIVAPGGCESNTGPCTDTVDTLKLSWAAATGITGANSRSDGARNTAILDAVLGTGVHPAAEFCADLRLGAYDDWFLPAVTQFELLLQTSTLVGALAPEFYWTSSETNADHACSGDPSTGGVSCAANQGTFISKPASRMIRCMRTEVRVEQLGCAIGQAGPGGQYALCDNEYNLVVMPSGCDGSTSNPVCFGGDDGSISMSFGGITADGATNVADGQANTLALDLIAGVTVRPAAEYCANMEYGGHSDWYLPAINELVAVQRVAAQIGGFANSKYWSSTVNSAAPAQAFNALDAVAENNGRQDSYLARCVRRD